jgi:hypothetical protein
MMETIIEPLRTLDWEDTDAIARATTKAFASLTADRRTLASILRDLPERPDLLGLCEHYDILDKIVLHDDPSGVRVRLHVFLPGHFDRPHNHRWSLVIRGPAVKDRFLVMDRTTGQSWWQ